MPEYKVMINLKSSKYLWVLYSIATILIIWGCFDVLTRNVTYGLNAVSITSSDEYLIFSRMKMQLDKGSVFFFQNGFYRYGGAYDTIVFFILKATGLFKKISLLEIAFVYRLVSLLSTILSSLCLFLIARRKQLTVGVSFILALIPFSLSESFLFSFLAHPDTLSSLFTLISIYFLITNWEKKPSPYTILFAALSTATKYAGFFLLPLTGIIYLVWFYKLNGTPGTDKKQNELHLMKLAVRDAFIFTAVFLFFNRGVLLEPQKFLADFKYEAKHIAWGHGFEMSKNPFLWLVEFSRDWSLPVFILFISSSILLVVLAVVPLFKKPPFRSSFFMSKINVNTALLIYVFYCSLHAALLIRYRNPRYLLHFIFIVFLLNILFLYKAKLKSWPAKLLKYYFPVFTTFLIWNTCSNFFTLFKTKQSESQQQAAKINFYKKGVEPFINKLGPAQKILVPSFSFYPDSLKEKVYEYWDVIDSAFIKEKEIGIIVFNNQWPAICTFALEKKENKQTWICNSKYPDSSIQKTKGVISYLGNHAAVLFATDDEIAFGIRKKN